MKDTTPCVEETTARLNNDVNPLNTSLAATASVALLQIGIKKLEEFGSQNTHLDLSKGLGELKQLHHNLRVSLSTQRRIDELNRTNAFAKCALKIIEEIVK